MPSTLHSVRPVLQALAPTFIAVGAGCVPQAVLQRRLAFPRLAAAVITANVIATVVGVVVAVMGGGVWALVVQTIVSIMIQAVLVFTLSGYRPGGHVSRQSLAGTLSTSRRYLGIQLAQFMASRSDAVWIGLILTAAEVGIYAVAFQVILIMVEVLSLTVGQVIFPMFARLQADTPRLASAYGRATRLTTLVALPVLGFVGAAAPDVVAILFGSQWVRSAPVLSVLTIFGAFQVLQQLNVTLLNSRGRQRVAMYFLAAAGCLQAVFILVSASHGLIWVSIAVAARAALCAPIAFVLASRELGHHARGLSRDLLAPVLLAGIIITVTSALQWALADQDVLLRASVCTGGFALTLTTIPLLAPRHWAELRSALRSASPHRRSPRAADGIAEDSLLGQ